MNLAMGVISGYTDNTTPNPAVMTVDMCGFIADRTTGWPGGLDQRGGHSEGVSSPIPISRRQGRVYRRDDRHFADSAPHLGKRFIKTRRAGESKYRINNLSRMHRIRCSCTLPKPR